MTTFKLPDLGEGLEEAEIVHWHVSQGDRLAVDQPLVSVETDKAVVEIPAPWAGKVAALFGKVGDVVKVGAPLAEIEASSTQDAGTVVGSLEATPIARGGETSKTAAFSAHPASARVRAAPAVRELAQQVGVDLSSVHGTGPQGTVTRADIELASRDGGEAASAALLGSFEALRGVRRAMARSMTRARESIVPATVTEEADISHWPPDAEVTLLAVEAVVSAAHAEPALNASFDGEREALRLNSKVDIGIAVDTPDGLIVPVLRSAAFRDRVTLRVELRRLIEGAMSRSLKREELLAPTISISNFGSLGGLFATLVVVPPQVAILGIGRIRDKQGSAETPMRLLPLSLTFDHRAVTGGEAARFITKVRVALENSGGTS
jgi:pyruvate dehydrogenase E2 component (dihydrolipoamide acetyltransferase)